MKVKNYLRQKNRYNDKSYKKNCNLCNKGISPLNIFERFRKECKEENKFNLVSKATDV
jgi:hypothetical protein